MKNFLEMPDDQKKKIIKEAVHESNWAQVKILYKKDLDKEIQKANKKCRFCGLYDNQVDTVMRNIDKDTRLDEMNRMLEKLKSGKWKSFATEVKDRIKQLEKGKE